MTQDGRERVYGADGCRGGWICAALARAGNGSRAAPTFQLYDTFAECLAATADGIVVVDIPIGLLDAAVAGGRPCDRLARQALGWPRRNSVFSPPARPALHAGEYREAARLNGSGMTQQAFRIIPKIREVDAAITPRSQTRIFEGHPEMSFLRLAGAGIEEPKRKAAGRQRRRVLIENALGVAVDLDAIRAELGRGRVAYDDVLDAAVLAITARHIAAGTALRLGAGERDSRGLEMAIWY